MADFKESFDKMMDTKDETGSMDKKDAEDNKIMGILAYIGILVLIPIFGAKESKFARFHANQGLVLLIVEVIIAIVFAILGAILGGVPVLGTIISIINWVISLCCLALAILGIYNAATGKAKQLPLIGGFQILK